MDNTKVEEELQSSLVNSDTTEINPEVAVKTEGKTRAPRLYYVPNRHDRRKAAAEARKAAKKKAAHNG